MVHEQNAVLCPQADAGRVDVELADRCLPDLDAARTADRVRIEPGGLLLLEGQRLGANDHYRFCLDMMDIDDDDLEVVDLDIDGNDIGC